MPYARPQAIVAARKLLKDFLIDSEHHEPLIRLMTGRFILNSGYGIDVNSHPSVVDPSGRGLEGTLGAGDPDRRWVSVAAPSPLAGFAARARELLSFRGVEDG